MANITIGGITVDTADPCAMVTALDAVRLRLIAGESVAETQIKSAVTGEMVRFQAADLAALEREIARYRDLCAAASGQRPSRRAIRAGFGPY